MIRITVELLPFGIESAKITLGVGYIANDGSGDHSTGNYKYTLHDKAGKVWKTGHIKGFPRQRLLAWDLLLRVLANCVGRRNKSSENQTSHQ